MTRPTLLRFCSSDGTLLTCIWIEKSGNRDNGICCHEQSTFQIVASTVQYKEVDNERRHEQCHGFKEAEVKAHVLSENPAEEYNNRCDEKSNLINIRDDQTTQGGIGLPEY